MSEYTHSARNKKYRGLDPLDYIHDYGLDLDQNEIFLFGREDYASHNQDYEPGIEWTLANQFIKNINILKNHSDRPILIHMKTCGGYWEEGMAIYDAIRSCPNRVIILNYTHARSMSSIILQSADYRVMMPHSTCMIHRGTETFEGTGTQFETEYKQFQKADDIMMGIYIEAMKGGELGKNSSAYLKKWIRNKMAKHEEFYMDAETSVNLGFADEVFGLNGIYEWDKLKK